MSVHEKELHPDEKVKLGSLGPATTKVAGGAGSLLLVVTVILGVTEGDEMERFFHTYLVSLTYFLTVALGALFFVILQPLVRARWSVVVRRLAEILSMTFPLLAVLTLVGIVIPMFAGNDGLYEWVNPDPGDHLLAGKTGYLNKTFFFLRLALYFGVWIFLSRWFFKQSSRQDETGDAQISERMRIVSAPALIAYAFTTAFAGFDLLMSLHANWYSTMFGVYFFSGSAIAIMAVLALVPMALQARGRLVHSITVEHYHDVGKLLFAFVFFWGYIAFSQFMLIWYADIPEETIWFKHRMMTDWSWLSLVLLFGHFIIPFVLLLSRETKRRLQLLAFFAVWMLVMHFADLFWIVMPEYDDHHFTFHAMDVTAFLGIGGLFVAYAAWVGSRGNLIPVKDPNLGKSLAFENI